MSNYSSIAPYHWIGIFPCHVVQCKTCDFIDFSATSSAFNLSTKSSTALRRPLRTANHGVSGMKIRILSTQET
jgi:hypothetical protein